MIRARPPAALAGLCVLALAIHGGIFAFLAVSHIRFPGFLETMEGDVLQHIRRLLAGEEVYPRPGPDFIALAYMPLYHFVCAPLLAFLGDGFAAQRIVSVSAALASAGLLSWIAWKESGSRPLACLAAAVFFAGFRIHDAYLTCGLPDSLMLLWVLLGFVFFAYSRSSAGDAAWLICFTLAFWTKQHGAFFFGFAVLYSLIWRRNFLPRWAIALGLVIGGPVSYAILGLLLGEGFFFHTFTIPRRWDSQVYFSATRTLFVLACFVPVLCLLTAVHLHDSRRRSAGRPAPLAWFTITSLVATAITMMASGSSNNHYIPFFSVLAVTGVLGAQTIARGHFPPRLLGWGTAGAAVASAGMTVLALRHGANHPIPVFVPFVLGIAAGAILLLPAVPALRIRLGPSVAVILLLAHFAAVYYSPRRFLPHPSYEAALQDFQSELRALGKPVAWADYGHAPVLLTGVDLLPLPSKVALADVERQLGEGIDRERDISFFFERLLRVPSTRILSNDRLEKLWPSQAAGLVLEKDYGPRFVPIAHAAPRWYTARPYPRYLYRMESRQGDGKP